MRPCINAYPQSTEIQRGLGTQGQVEELWVESAKVTNLDDPAATRKSAIQAAKERGCEYKSSIQGTVFYYTMPCHKYLQNYEQSFLTENEQSCDISACL